jgi:heat shock protein HslJ
VKHLTPSSHALRAPRQPVAVASLCLGLLAGCAQPSASSSSASPTHPSCSIAAPSAARILSGHHWLLQRASTAQGAEQAGWKPSGPGVEGKDVQLDFTSEGMLSVHNLCNQLAGRYTLDGNRILVEQLVSTMRACNNRSLMELEQRVAQRLAQLDSWQLLRTAKVLPPHADPDLQGRRSLGTAGQAHARHAVRQRRRAQFLEWHRNVKPAAAWPPCSASRCARSSTTVAA